MFTGLIEKIGTLSEKSINGEAGKLTVKIEKQFQNLTLGESIAVNGVCLTLEKYSDNTITFHILNETLKKTNLGILPQNSPLNLERALAVGSRLGGHFVSGHIDTPAKILSWTKNDSDIILSIELPSELSKYIVEKGSIAVDGVSLTIASLSENSFNIHLIPTTLNETALYARKKQMLVNLETDMLGKYVEKQLASFMNNNDKNQITMSSLINAGW